MIVLFELFLRLTCLYDIRRKMQIYGAHELMQVQKHWILRCIQRSDT